MMSKKHYVEFAQMFKKERESLIELMENHADSLPYEERELELDLIIRSTADIFQSDNPNFDRSRFLNACGLTSK